MNKIKNLPEGKFLVEIESIVKKVKTNDGNYDVSCYKGGDSAHFVEIKYRVIECLQNTKSYNGWVHYDRLYLWHTNDFAKQKNREKWQSICSAMELPPKDTKLNELKSRKLYITITHNEAKDGKVWVNVKKYEKFERQAHISVEDDILPY